MNLDANELSIRTRLIDHLKELEGEDAAFISEMFIDNFARRADLIVANGRLSAYEIKSANDDCARLAGQLETYVALFENVTIVCAQKHTNSVLRIAGSSVGILVMTAEGQFEQIRPARKNRMRKADWLTFLTVIELRKLLRQCGYVTHGDRATLLATADKISVGYVRSFVLDFLKSGRQQRIDRNRARREAISADRQTQAQRDAMIREYALTLTGRKLVPIPRVKVA